MKSNYYLMIFTVVFSTTVLGQTTKYADFEAVYPNFHASNSAPYSIVDNPSKTGINTSDKCGRNGIGFDLMQGICGKEWR